MTPSGKPRLIGIKSQRTCPRCNVALYLVERGGERLDICHGCGGIWFDRAELAGILGSESSVELLIGISKDLKGEGLLCPSCREVMSTREVYEVFVDLCHECNGIWMDKGETEKIWAKDEKTRHPFGIGVDEADPERFWDRFRVKYYGFENLDDE